MTRAKLASVLTRLISGENRIVTGVTAFCLTGMVLLGGSGLAQAAHSVRSQLAGSEILARFINREPSNPQQTALFLRYLNAMAPAVLNLEIPPEEQIQAFQTLYTTAETCGVTLRVFSFQEGRLDVSCTGKDSAASRLFFDAVKAAGQFSNVTMSDHDNSNNFTVHCDFI